MVSRAAVTFSENVSDEFQNSPAENEEFIPPITLNIIIQPWLKNQKKWFLEIISFLQSKFSNFELSPWNSDLNAIFSLFSNRSWLVLICSSLPFSGLKIYVKVKTWNFYIQKQFQTETVLNTKTCLLHNILLFFSASITGCYIVTILFWH